MNSGSYVIPGLRYAEPDAAIEFLKGAFGFAEHGVFRAEDGKVVHAQLTLGAGMVMLGPDDSLDMKENFVTPRQNGDRSTAAIYVAVSDPDGHFSRATSFGAEIVKPLADAEYGGRGHTCRDPEGHVWEFGSYDPWAVEDKAGTASTDHRD